MAGMLSSHTFSPERIEEWNRKIKKTEDFIQKNESLLEQVKEKNVSLMRCIKKIVESLRKYEKSRKKKCFLI